MGKKTYTEGFLVRRECKQKDLYLNDSNVVEEGALATGTAGQHSSMLGRIEVLELDHMNNYLRFPLLPETESHSLVSYSLRLHG